MSPLVVEVDGRVLRLEGSSVIRIGRAIDAEVVLTAGSVSRQHAELRPVDGQWVLVDTGSQFGTYVNGVRVVEHTITGRTLVRCGPVAAGSELAITPASMATEDEKAAVQAPAPPPPPAPSESFDEPTMPPAAGGRPVEHSRFAPPPPPVPSSGPAAPGSVVPGPSGTRVARPTAPSPPPAIPAGFDQTQVLAAQPAAPPGPGGPPPARSGPDLLLVAEGKEHRFRHPAQITIGRLPDCTVVLTDPAASRMHGVVAAVPGGWTYSNQSNEGTFLNGRRVTTKRFDERTQLRLGHPVAGPELTLVPILSAMEEEKRIARRRFTRNLLIGGVVTGVLVLVFGAAGATILLSRNDDGDRDNSAGDRPSTSVSSTGATDATTGPGSPEELTEAELDAAKAATVKIIAESHSLADPDEEFAYAGSGSIIRADGLILTNAHVAAPESPGIVEQYGQEAAIANPEYLLISITDGATDTTSPPEYRARVVEADGYLDVAVIQIYAKADGSALDGDLALPAVPIGSSADVRAGDDVTVLGFPAVAGSGDSITVTTGAISTVLNDPDLGPRSEFDTEARIAPGNSGGMAVDNDGQLIGLPTAIEFDPSGTGVTSGRIRAIDVVKDLIESAEQQVG